MRKKTRREEDAAFGKAMKKRMDKQRISVKALCDKWEYPEFYVEMIIKDWLPYDDEIKEICKILDMRKRWKGRDLI
jgi:hypothetical protein